MGSADNAAMIYVYDGGRFHEVLINGEVFYASHLGLDRLLVEHAVVDTATYQNGCPPGAEGDYSRGCWRHRRPVPASIDRPCCIEAADEIYTWWDEINKRRALT